MADRERTIGLRRFGKTGLEVSALSLGTVSLGVDYGIDVPDDFGRPSEESAASLLRTAVKAGITLFDTAPAYGTSERLLGKTLGQYTEAHFASKITIPKDHQGNFLPAEEFRTDLLRSLQASTSALHRSSIDVVQIHNATVEMFADDSISRVLCDAKQQGLFRFLGASVYTEAEALAVIATGCFDVLQVPFSILDQRMASRVFPAASAAGIAVMCRSALLKGVLSPKAKWLPSEMEELKSQVVRVMEALDISWHELTEMALRFCLSFPQVSTVLIGARTGEELQEALHAAEAGPLPAGLISRVSDLSLNEERLWNPARWPLT